MNGKPQALRFERVRTFGRLMSDTRKFIRDNFVVFFKTILFLVGPVALITCALESYYVIMLQNPDGSPDMEHFGSYLALPFIYSQFRWAINGFVTAIVVSHFIKTYREKGEGKFEVGDVTRSIFRDFGGILLAFLVLLLGVTLVGVILGYMIYGLANVSMGAAVLAGIAGFIGYFLIRFPMWYYLFSVFFARTRQPKTQNVFPAMGYAAKVFSGNWWQTWVAFFLMWLILWLLGYAIALPATVGQGIAKLSTVNIDENSPDWKMVQTILMTLGEFAKTIISSVFCITVALQFFSLKEKLDGEGTKELVDTIGKNNDDDGVELTW